jgi:SAM-dependent methyltransferase
MSSQEKAAAVEARYTGAEGLRYHAGKRGVPEAAIPWIARLRSEKIQPWVREGDTIFEYGVGGGWNLARLKCARRIGYDISEHVADQVKALGIELVPGTRELSTQSADAVICHHTLEHLLDPSAALTEMRRILKPGGKLLVFVPFEKERRYRRFDPEEPNHHLFSWNVQTLGNLVMDCGFRLLHAEVAGFGYDRFAAKWAVRMHVGERGFRVIRRLGHLVRPGLEVRVLASNLD